MIGILGGGLAGLSAAFHIERAGRRDYVVLEKEGRPGGLSRSWSAKGYTFDYGPHIIYTRDEYAMGLFRLFLKGNLAEKQRENWIWLHKTLVKYPFETFLHGLPPEVIMECLEGVLDARKREPGGKPANFREWILQTFGEGMAKHYFIPYNLKVWKHPLERMGIDWIYGRVPSPDIKDMMRGALGIQNREFGPNAMFQYPVRGGIGSLPAAMAACIGNLRTGCRISGISKVEGGLSVSFESRGKEQAMTFPRLISTLPLPDLVELLDDAPQEVRRAAGALVFTSLVCMGIGVKRPGVSDKHSIYYPDKGVLFNRVSFPMNMAASTAPRGRSSILAEVTVRKGERPDLERTADRIVSDLLKTGLLRRGDDIDYREARTYSHGYVVYDLDHRRNVDLIHGYLRSIGILPAGRFGEWEYHNMDKSMLSGRRAAAEAMQG
jgi:UDP-galactopyranose mutase